VVVIGRLSAQTSIAMIVNEKTGIGPALRVLRHCAERQRFDQIKFESGERALVLVTDMPSPSIELVRLALGGVIPWQTVWEYNPTRAGGYSDYIRKLKSMFSLATERSDDSLHSVREALLGCQSIEEARLLLLRRERLANGSANESAGFTRREPSSVIRGDDWELGIRDGLTGQRTTPDRPKHNDAERGNDKPEPSFSENLDRTRILAVVPDRYRIIDEAQGKVITCLEAPTVRIRAKRGLATSAKQARNSAPGTIFLDGAAEGDPFIDAQREVYNLDHHQGCIRSLATCEQAILLIRKLHDLRTRDWLVLVNDADIDTILAVWVLLNHLRMNDSAVRAKVLPLLRLEGVTDAHGPDAQYLSALPSSLLNSTSTMLKELRQQEIVSKHYGRWSEIDLQEYIADRLRAIDKLIYSAQDFEGLHEVDELARAEIANQSVVIACRSEAGVNGTEQQLRKIYGERLGILIIQNASSAYEMRQLDQTVSTPLERAYERLNLLDPAVRGGSQSRWHGSAAMGASPRDTGTGLTPDQIVAAVRDAFRQPTITDVISELPRALSLALTGLLPALLLIVVGSLLRDRGYIAPEWVFLSTVVLPVTAAILFWPKARRAPGIHGLRAPTSFSWLITLPVALIAAMTGGVWAPASLGYGTGPHNLNEFSACVAFLLPIGAELLFRGLILGSLALRLPIQPSGEWWRSWPTLISSALYAAASVLLLLAFSSGQAQMIKLLGTFAAALAFGITSGIARERSESIFASIVLHSVCAAALILSGSLLF
jgi:membrane protease YdiL (CAAX protease family)